MKKARFHDVPSQLLPQGRFLHRVPELPRYDLYGRRDDPRLWISAFELSEPSRAAGPFEPHEAVRALRLANLSIPDGCELGPWQDGLGFFEVGRLPGRASEWEPIEPAWLEPSVTRYAAEDITGETVRVCCAPPKSPPDVIWDDEDVEDLEWESPPELLDFALKPIYARYPILRTARRGLLANAWNGHPELSLIWAPTGSLEGGFYIADFEFPEGTDFGHPRASIERVP
jgi:hypothetical protein